MNKLVSGAIGIEIHLQDGKFKFNFPEVMNLRNKRIKHIDFCFASNLTTTPSNVNISELTSGIFLTLREANTQQELISTLPVNELNSSGNRLFINKIIDLPQSYVELTGNPADLNDTAFYFVFWYDEPKVWENIPKNCRTRIESFDLVIEGAKTYFKDFRNLINRKYQNIILSLPLITPAGNTGIDADELKTKFITLSKDNYDFFSDVPLYLFYQANQNFKLRLQNISFDFQKSYISDLGSDSGKGIFFNAIIDDNK